MSSKYSTKQYINEQYCDKQMSEIWCKNIQAFLRYSNFRVRIFYFASPCIYAHCMSYRFWDIQRHRMAWPWNLR